MTDKEKIKVLKDTLTKIALYADVQSGVSKDSKNLLSRISIWCDDTLNSIKKVENEIMNRVDLD